MSNLKNSNSMLAVSSSSGTSASAADLNASSFQSSSLLNLLNISQQFSSPSSLHLASPNFKSYSNLQTSDNYFSTAQHQQQQQQFPFSIFSQFCSQLKPADDDSDRSSPQNLHRSKQAKCSNLEKNSIYQ